MAADTMVSVKGVPLPLTKGVLKFCCLPGYLCVAYSGSPELAAKDFFLFQQTNPLGTNFDAAVRFFEQSSARTHNEYILAFGSTPRLITVKDGRRVRNLSKTHWIGDRCAFEIFREHEHRERHQNGDRRAVSAVLFADEMNGSPASDLHGVMRNVILDRAAPSGVGGFVTVVANRDIGFRFSAYSDILLDWPTDLARDLQLTDKVDLVASGENDRYSVSQVSPGYYNMNLVAFYLLKGKLLIVFLGCNGGQPGRCHAIPNVEPANIGPALNEFLGFDFRALSLVMSCRKEFCVTFPRANPDHGLAMNLFCEANTFAIPQPDWR